VLNKSQLNSITEKRKENRWKRHEEEKRNARAQHGRKRRDKDGLGCQSITTCWMSSYRSTVAEKMARNMSQ